MEQIHRKRIEDLIEIVPCFIDMVALWPYLICDIPTFPLVARRFSQPGFGRSGGVGNERIVETVVYN